MIKTHLVSYLQTFAAAFITALAALLANGSPIQWTWIFWASVLLAAVRTAIKVFYGQVMPVSLGGLPK